MTRPPKYRFHLDENFPASAGKFLASMGHNVTYAARVDKGRLRGKSDYHQLRFSRKEQRIFLTIDRDFRQRHLAELIADGPGVIAVRGETSHVLLQRVLQFTSKKKLQGRICLAGPGTLRIIAPRV